MSDLQGKKIPMPESFGQTKTLFTTEPGRVGILVENRNGKRKQTAMNFRDGHEALEWCRGNAVTLVYMVTDTTVN